MKHGKSRSIVLTRRMPVMLFVLGIIIISLSCDFSVAGNLQVSGDIPTMTVLADDGVIDSVSTRSRVDLYQWKMKMLGKATEENPSDDEGMREGFFKPDFNDKDWRDFNLDYHAGGSEMSRPAQVIWFQTHFATPNTFDKGKRLRLCFQEVHREATVWVNGKKVGYHLGRFTPFSFDITDCLRPSGDNVVAVRVFNDTFRNSMRTLGLAEQVHLEVTPAQYVDEILVAPRLDKGGILVDFRLVNTQEKGCDVSLVGTVKPWDQTSHEKVTKGILEKVQAPPGCSSGGFFLPLDSPVLWDMENPFLYVLRLDLRDAKGNLVDSKTVRFGYRQFVTEGDHFLLNGKRILLTGLVLYSDLDRDFPWMYRRNNGKYIREMLTLLKRYHVNILRPHSNPLPTAWQDIADEMGMLTVNEREGHYVPHANYPKNASEMTYPFTLEETDEWVRHYYNHPSVVIWDFGNELWQMYANFTPYLTKAYHVVKQLDRSNRPILSSSGRGSHGVAEGLAQPSDFIAVHSYIGGIGGPWNRMSEYLRSTKKAYDAAGGKKPFVLFETIAGCPHKVHQPELCPFCADPDYIVYHQNQNQETTLRGHRFNPGDIREFVKIFRASNQQPRDLAGYGGYLAPLGPKAAADGNAESHFFAYHNKRTLEEWRRVSDICPGLLSNQFNTAYSSVLHSGSGNWLGGPMIPQPVLTEAYGIVFNPWFVCTDVFDKDVFAGRQLRFQLYVMNDSTRDSKSELNVIVRVMKTLGSKDQVMRQVVPVGKLKASQRRIMPYAWDIPKDLPTGIYRLNLALYDGPVELLLKDRNFNYCLSNNHYYFYILNPADRLKRIANDGLPTALYVGKGEPLPMKLESILKRLGVKYDVIKNLSELNKYDTLIITPDALDYEFTRYGRAVQKWIEDGGWVLCLSQSKAQKIPWLPQIAITRNGGVSRLELPRPDHPIFSGLNAFTFEGLNAKPLNFLSNVTLSTIDESVLAAGCELYDNKVLNIIEERKIGKGESIISLVDAVNLYDADSAATKYLENLLRYVLSRKSVGFSSEPLQPLSQEELAAEEITKPDKEGFIRDWLVLGPFPNPPVEGSVAGGKPTYRGFSEDYLKPIGGETAIEPNPEKQSIRFYDESLRGKDVAEGQECMWSAFTSSGPVDFLNLFGGDYKVAYAACYIDMDEDMDAVLAVGSDDGCKVYLNHKLVHENPAHRSMKADEDQVRVKLKKGRNVLLVKIDQRSGGWQFCLRFLDPATKKPVTGYTIRLRP